MLSKIALRKSSVSGRKNRWFERLIAVLALVNLVLIFFDLSYVPLRDFYLKTFPPLTQAYDPVKGIEPHPETQDYLNKVNELKEQVSQTGLQSPQAAELLEEVRTLSRQMIEDNPFDVANKSNTLEKIKNEIRSRAGEDSARSAFAVFWSKAYLSQVGWQEEINFFNTQIRPLIEKNYYRDINRFGKLSFFSHICSIDLNQEELRKP
jgi:hypothetical protein